VKRPATAFPGRRPAALGAVAALGLLALLGACSKDKDVEPPAALVDFDAKLSVERVWDAGLGGKDKALRLALAPDVEGDRVYAAGPGGDLYAFDAGSGRTLWHAKTKLPLSAGPGSGEGLVVVGTSDGRLAAYGSANGERRWEVRLSGEVLARPAVTATAVIVRTVDGHVRALAPDTGKELWTDDEAVPRLTLRGTAPPVAAGDTVVCAFDNGKVAAYSLNNGDVLWETAVTPPRGRTELERLVDIDGGVKVSGRDVFTVGFQGRVAMLALDSGQIWWARDLSSYRGLALDGETLYVTAADSKVQALRRRDGTPVWSTDKLVRRGLTAPAIDGQAVVVADFQGYVHWLDAGSGALLGRYGIGKVRVTNAPVAANGLVYVQNDAGKLVALRARGRGAPAPAAAPTPPAPTPQ
jgi:outer membrane protein assembly factor BamB